MEINGPKITKETLATAAELAVVLNLTSRRIRQLADEGIIHSVSKNQYPLAESVAAYQKYLKTQLPSDENADLAAKEKKATVKLKESKANIAEMQAKELAGQMHRSEDVEAMTSDLIYAVRGALMALPGRLAVNVMQAKTAAEASDIIRKEIYQVMDELSGYSYDPEKYAERVRQRMDWESSAQEQEQEDEG